ncbi:MAG: cytochrome c oxidase subunit 3 [Oceanospirillaceae bacterium]|nr:cytochrome c oxidase subunit 3 [Oceanospirillaceae bacterium]MCP5350388.1 cytochrome c oxidase subunit 3 [Oceanospirillaceae bacterium]
MAETLARKHLPGDLAVWFFILAELSVFAALIIAFGVTQILRSDMFHSSREALNTSTSLYLTISLLSAGGFAALAVATVRRGQQRAAAFLLLSALASAAVYVLIKLAEYKHLAGLGLDLSYNTFFTLYWLVTGFHFLHVLLGMLILGFMALRCWRLEYQAENLSGLEAGVIYWHMVDLVWVILFPVIYVLH